MGIIVVVLHHKLGAGAGAACWVEWEETETYKNEVYLVLKNLGEKAAKLFPSGGH